MHYSVRPQAYAHSCTFMLCLIQYKKLNSQNTNSA